MTRDQLIELAKAVSQAKRVWECYAASNTYGLTPERRVDLDAAYRVAQDEWFEADRRYRDALDEYNRRPSDVEVSSEGHPLH